MLSAYRGFAPEMAEIARTFFDSNWIDAPVRPGKAPGAFAHPTVPSAHPYVLLNYMGKPRDVMTLAHELGHGVHQVLAGAQGALMASTPLTLAETASVFGEMLTFRALLDQHHRRRERKAMLAQKVEDMINTVVRQIAFYEFERKVHTERKNGELTSDQLGEIWLEVQSESLGPAIRLREGYETFWTYIPHFIHSPFYVYAYAFGDCLVNSLYAVYQNAERGFQEKYFEMLKAGGTKHHSELLAPSASMPPIRLLADGACGDRRADRRAGGAGIGRDCRLAAAVPTRGSDVMHVMPATAHPSPFSATISPAATCCSTRRREDHRRRRRGEFLRRARRSGSARGSGKWLAGYFSYEAGYLFEPKLRPLLPEGRRAPLLCLRRLRRAVGPRRREAGRPTNGPIFDANAAWSFADYEPRFARVHRHLREGDCYQANLPSR